MSSSSSSPTSPSRSWAPPSCPPCACRRTSGSSAQAEREHPLNQPVHRDYDDDGDHHHHDHNDNTDNVIEDLPLPRSQGLLPVWRPVLGQARPPNSKSFTYVRLYWKILEHIRIYWNIFEYIGQARPPACKNYRWLKTIEGLLNSRIYHEKVTQSVKVIVVIAFCSSAGGDFYGDNYHMGITITWG